MADELENRFPDEFAYYNGHADDVSSHAISDALPGVLNFMEEARRAAAKKKSDGSSGSGGGGGGRLAVHCAMGISRAPCAVIAWLMRERRMTRDDATEFVRARRSVIRPNKGFMEQLAALEKQWLDNAIKKS